MTTIEMTHEQVFARLKAKYPTFVIDDYRPADGISYGLIVWEKETLNKWVVQYRPDLDEFFVLSIEVSFEKEWMLQTAIPSPCLEVSNDDYK